MRDYVSAIYGWDEALQRRMFYDRFDPALIRIIQVEGRDAGLLEVREGTDHIFIARIEVTPACQRQGIGTAVIKSILADSREKGRPVILQVLRSNPARALYERLGFSVYAETPTHFKMRKEPDQALQPAARMHRS